MPRRKKSFSYISTVVRKHHQLQEPILTPRQKQKTSTLSIKLHIFQSTNKRQPVLFKEEKFSVDLHYIKIYNEENNYRHRFIQRLSNFSRSRKSCRKRYQKHKILSATLQLFPSLMAVKVYWTYSSQPLKGNI